MGAVIPAAKEIGGLTVIGPVLPGELPVAGDHVNRELLLPGRPEDERDGKGG